MPSTATATATGAGSPVAVDGPRPGSPAESTGPSGDPGPAGVGVQLLDGTASGRASLRQNVYIVDHLAPGERIQRRIEVSNPGDAEQRVELYPGAATVENVGFGFATGRTGNELTSWVRLEPTALNLPPAGRGTVTATIAVPEQATRGEHYGVVWAEVVADPASPTQVVQVGRAGVRVYLSVGPGGAPAADFQLDQLAATRDPAGEPMVTARVHNTGDRALDLSGELSLSDGPGALTAGPYRVQVETLGIGATGMVTVPLDAALPAGDWRARLTLVDGYAQRTASAPITIVPAASGAASRSGERTTTTTLTALGLLGVGGGTVWFLGGHLRRRRRRHHRGAVTAEAAP